MPAVAATSALPAAAAASGARLVQCRRRCVAPRSVASADSSSLADAAVLQGGTTPRRQHQQAQQQPQQRRRWHRAQSSAPAAAEPAGRLDLRSLGLKQLVELACGGDQLEPRHALAVLHALSWELKQQRQRGAPPPLPDQALPRLFAALQRGCGELQVRDLVLMLQLCTRLRARPPQALLDAAAQQLCHRLPAEAPAQSVTAVWMLTRLGHQAGVSSLLAAIDAQVQRQVPSSQAPAGAEQQQEQQQHHMAAAAGQPEQDQQHERQHHVAQQLQQQLSSRDESTAPPPAWLAQLPPLLLVHLLWVCGKAGYRSVPLLCGICAALLHSAEAARPAMGGAPAPLAGLDGKLLAMVWYSLGLLQWAPGPERSQFVKHAALQARAALPTFTSQGLSNAAWALPRLAPLPAADGLAAALAAAAAPRLAEFSNQELGMLLVALSQRGGPASWRPVAVPQLYEAAGEQLAVCAPRLGERDLCSMLSALVTAGHRPSDAALAAVAARAETLLPDRLPPASLAWLLWSFAHLRAQPPRSLLRRAEAALRGPQLLALYAVDGADVARLCWALAELKYYSGALLADLSAVLRSMWERLPAQSMTLALRSFALQNFTPHDLLDVAAEHLAAHLDDSYDPHSVALSMWAFGRLGVHPGRGLPSGGLCTPEGVPLLEAVAAYALRHVGLPEEPAGGSQPAATAAAPAEASEGRGAFTLQGLSMLLWSFATLEHHPGTALLQATGKRFVAALPHQQGAAAADVAGLSTGGPTGSGGSGDPGGGDAAGVAAAPECAACLRSVSQAAWAFAKFGYADEAFFLALVEQVDHLPLKDSSPEEAPQSLTSLAYAAAKLRVGAAPALLRGLLPPAQQHMQGFNSEEVCQLLWALAAVGGLGGAVQAHAPLLDAAAARLAADLARGGAGVDPRLLCMAVHALAELQYRCDDSLLAGCVRAVAAAGADVPVSLLAKLLWGCAHVGHVPEAGVLEGITADLYYRLSHRRGNRTVLQVPDLVLLLWALAALGQYTTQLYRNVAFRATRLPEGVPEAPRLRRLLREATVLHSCEYRLDPVAAEAAAAILPAWMAGQAAAAAEAAQQGAAAQQQQQAEAPWLLKPAAPPVQAPLPTRDGSGAPPAERRAEAEAVCTALLRSGMRASLKQLSYGDYIVAVEKPGSQPGSQAGSGSDSDDGSSDESSGGGGRRRQRGPKLACAVVPASPATGRAAYNKPSCLLGSALVAQRVLSARELPAVPGTGGETEVVKRSKAALRRGGSD